MENLYYSVLVTRRLLCNCSAISYPHSAGGKNCCSIVPSDLDSIPLKISATAKKRAYDLLNDKFC